MVANLEDCKFIREIPLSWGEMDAFHHINNVAYFRYFETARIAYLESINYRKIYDESKASIILASVNAKFIAPLFYPDTIKVGVRIPEVNKDRFTMDYVLFSNTQNRIAAIGSSIIVTFDYQKNMKVDIPEDMRKLLTS